MCVCVCVFLCSCVCPCVCVTEKGNCGDNNKLIIKVIISKMLLLNRWMSTINFPTPPYAPINGFYSKRSPNSFMWLNLRDK